MRIAKYAPRITVLLSLFFTAPCAFAQTIAPSAFDFGVVFTGNASLPQDFTFTNTGAAPLVMNPASISGPGAMHFTINNDGCSGQNMAPAQMCAINVSFTPFENGAHQATLAASYFDPNGAPGAVNADLSGMAQPMGGPTADVSIDLVPSVAQVTPGDAINVSVTLANAGSDDAVNLEVVIDLPVGSTSISGGGNGVVCVIVNQTATCTLPQLNVLADVTFDIDFNAPAAAGGYSIAGTVGSETFDPNLSNNSDFEELIVAGTPPPPPAQPVPALPNVALMLLVGLFVLVGCRSSRF